MCLTLLCSSLVNGSGIGKCGDMAPAPTSLGPIVCVV